MRIPQLKLLRCYSLVIVLLTTFFLVSKDSTAQENEAYEKTFKEKFPTVAAPMWIRKADDTYEATFKLNGAFVSSVYTVDGKWLFTKSPVEISKIPAAVTNAVSKKYRDFKITSSEKVETADNKIQYKLSLKAGTKRSEALFDEQGIFIK